MKNLLLTIARGLVKHPDEITIDETRDSQRTATKIYRLHVAPDDLGRVIGKQGRIAWAIRLIVRSAASRKRKKIRIEIGDLPDEA